MKYILTLCIVIIANISRAQQDSTYDIHEGHNHDSLYIIHENIPKSKFWGNSWYSGISYTLCKSNEFSINIGRTYGKGFTSGAGFNFTMKSWGIGYSYYQKRNIHGQIFSAFGEFSNFFLPPVTGRVDYLYDPGQQAHYFRPSAGISFFAFDLLYNYSFMLHGKTNDFKHGVTFRFKYFINNKNWEKLRPSRC